VAYEKESGPLGSERGDYQAALVAHTVATMLGSGKGQRPSLSDFLLRWGPRRRQSAKEMLDVFRALASRTKE
jgi:hypothetical protein